MTAQRKHTFGHKQVSLRQGRLSARKYAREQARLRDSMSRGFQKKIVNVFNRTIHKATRSLKDQQIPEIGVLTKGFRDDFSVILSAQIRKVYSSTYEANYDRIKTSNSKAEPFDFGRDAVFEAAVGKYFRQRANMISGIADTTAREILNQIDYLRSEDNNLDEISRKLSKQFAPIAGRRANVIARTETHSAAGFANDDYYRTAADSYGIQMIKQWVSTSDSRTRRSHALMNGVKVPMDSFFSMPNGAKMKFCGDSSGGAANVVNCRCVTLYHDPEDEVVDAANLAEKEDFDFDGVWNSSSSPISKKEYEQHFLSTTSAKCVEVARRLPKPREFGQTTSARKNGEIAGFYNGRKRLINSNAKGYTFAHEYGHHVDNMLVGTEYEYWSEGGVFARAFRKDRKSLGLTGGDRNAENRALQLHSWKKRLYNVGENTRRSPPKGESYKFISDVVDAFSDGEFQSFWGSWGHGPAYYKTKGSKESETFANMYALHDKPEWEDVKKWFPNVAKAFEDKINEVIDG